MKKKKQVIITGVALFALTMSNIFPGIVLSSETKLLTGKNRTDVSLKKEVQHAIEKGLKWLEGQQNPIGYWSQPEYPALTALVLTGFMGHPHSLYKAEMPSFIKKGYAYLLKCTKNDGGIYVTDLATYNTSIAMMALQVAGNSAYEDTLQNGRNFLVGLQDTTGEKNPYYGGVGYGGTHDHSDMSNTVFVLEALYYTKALMQEDVGTKNLNEKSLNWSAAIKFIERCQNLPSQNDQPWASDDPENKGGFVYFPGESKAGEVKLPSGKIALRSYGSMSYAGLLSYIYADLDRDDPRVTAVYDWLRKNFTLEENPGMGAEGLYYYYHTMAKALAHYGVEELVLETGKKINWRKDLALKLLNLQKGDGFWVNDSGRWWERDPVLVTTYAVIAMEILYRGL